MRWFRYSLAGLAFLFAIYALAMYYLADESKTFLIEKEVSYPVEKVFPQFSNLQNFSRWNKYFADSKKVTLHFFAPYEGSGAAMNFHDAENDRSGELFVRYAKPNKDIKYQLFEGKGNAYLIDLKFIPHGNHTRIFWSVRSPRQPLLERSANYFSKFRFMENLDGSMAALTSVLGNKIDKDKQLAAIKYDSLMVENQSGILLLGVNVSTANKGNSWYNNIVLNHNKVYNFVTVDMGKKEDETGYPVMITDPRNYRQKDVSYFYGIPLSRRQAISDNNFSFLTVSPARYFTIYYKGTFSGRTGAIQKLLNKAAKDTMRTGDLQQQFLDFPADGAFVNMKLSLPVFR